MLDPTLSKEKKLELAKERGNLLSGIAQRLKKDSQADIWAGVQYLIESNGKFLIDFKEKLGREYENAELALANLRVWLEAIQGLRLLTDTIGAHWITLPVVTDGIGETESINKGNSYSAITAICDCTLIKATEKPVLKMLKAIKTEIESKFETNEDRHEDIIDLIDLTHHSKMKARVIEKQSYLNFSKMGQIKR